MFRGRVVYLVRSRGYVVVQMDYLGDYYLDI